MRGLYPFNALLSLVWAEAIPTVKPQQIARWVTMHGAFDNVGLRDIAAERLGTWINLYNTSFEMSACLTAGIVPERIFQRGHYIALFARNLRLNP